MCCNHPPKKLEWIFLDFPVWIKLSSIVSIISDWSLYNSKIFNNKTFFIPLIAIFASRINKIWTSWELYTLAHKTKHHECKVGIPTPVHCHTSPACFWCTAAMSLHFRQCARLDFDLSCLARITFHPHENSNTPWRPWRLWSCLTTRNCGRKETLRL